MSTNRDSGHGITSGPGDDFGQTCLLVLSCELLLHLTLVLELLLLILMGENNIYTNKPFSETNVENITSKYSTELKMLKRAYGK